MMLKRLNIVTSCCAAGVIALWCVVPGSRVAAQATADDPVKVLVGRLDLEKYKATIKALTLFGDRLQGTDRNKAAIEWIAETLKSYGCTPERLQYTYAPAAPAQPATPTAAPPPLQIASGEVRTGVGGSRQRGMTSATTGSGPDNANLAANPMQHCGN